MTRPAPPIARLPRCTRCQSPTVPSSATYWHIGDMTTRLGITSSRRRNGVNMGGGTRAPVSSGCAVCRAASSATKASTRPRNSGIAHAQVFVRDAERSREQRERELQRRLAHVSLGLLEPRERRLRGALQALDLRPPAGLVRLEPARDGLVRRQRSRRRASRGARVLSATASSMAMRVPDPTEKCAVCAASPMSTMRSTDHGRVTIVGNCRQMLRFVLSAMAVELVGEQPLQKRRALVLGRAIEARGAPRLVAALDDERRAARLVLVRVHAPQAVLVALEIERERRERLRRAEPDEAIRPQVDGGLNAVAEQPARACCWRRRRRRRDRRREARRAS